MTAQPHGEGGFADSDEAIRLYRIRHKAYIV
jgi:hypothetical protein